MRRTSSGSLTRLAAHPVGGVLAVRVADTLKRAQAAGGGAEGCAIEATQERADLWRALTPQMFRYASAVCGAGSGPRRGALAER